MICAPAIRATGLATLHDVLASNPIATEKRDSEEAPLRMSAHRGRPAPTVERRFDLPH
jgi:hypothetical protein